ncbi:efflux RND transporter permease subunit [Pseudodesulfovibrio aespoeensis]|uniref:efflux RND transporter permease subunit n=1 Tax=Pseudodesulfovibrio aespoeensis TaxID=182210 RepID=UPI0023533BDC|nr:efflux RND transporter permease subunit [Pseudodesulfovibrio aespoeensis]MCG2732021.1 efflux RND transporter permease subunit [Pseudodesulfovibrio aespoeensis]
MEAAHAPQSKFDWSRLVFMLTGVALFTLVYFSPAWPDAIDPTGQHFVLSHEAKGALAVFLLAGTWWVFEVVPIGITSLMIGILQVMFLIRPAKSAFKDFMDPSVLFIFASIMIGLVFTKTGLTKRLAYKMLDIVGERTSMIYLGVFVVTAALTHIMAHTAVAATIYPLLLAIYALLAIPFRSYLQPLIVMSAIPYGIVGAVAGHVLMGLPMTILSMFGIVALSGVVVNDSLVMIDYINRAREGGTPLHQAVMEAGVQRFRPILLTTLTTFFGLLPMILEKSVQAQFLIPMAISLGFGVVVATTITLVLIPASYTILEDFTRILGVVQKGQGAPPVGE